MRDYARVAPTFWTRGSGKRLRGCKEGQIVALYLMTSPATSMVGIFHLGLPTLIHETGLTSEEALEGLRRCSEEGLAYWDEDSELVWVPALALHQIGERMSVGRNGKPDNRVAGIRRAVQQFRGHRFFELFMERYADPYLLSESEGEAPSKPLSSPYEGVSRARARHSAPALVPVPDPEGGPGGPEPESSDQTLLVASERPEFKAFERSFRGHMPAGEDWLDDETLEFAKRHGLDVAAEVADQRDYAKSKALLSNDWNAELRRSMRRHVEQGRGTSKPRAEGGGSRTYTGELVDGVTDDELGEVTRKNLQEYRERQRRAAAEKAKCVPCPPELKPRPVLRPVRPEEPSEGETG